MTEVDHPVVSPKKLIEVALPLDAINAACAREKSIRHGHPSTLHLWWARRPLAAARAVIFSQLVNDPEDLWRHQNPGKEANAQVRGHWTKARAKLFSLIEELVLWENTTNEEVLNRARAEIQKSWREVCELNKNHPQAADLFNPDKMPGLHDPFAGGGAIPLEAQRLGLEAYASDLNPVAVLINKAMIEIPPKFAAREPVNPEWQSKSPEEKAMRVWKRAEGLAEDVRYYGKWMRDEAEKRIGHLYPKVDITAEMAKERPDLEPLVGQKLTVIAWIWARTVKSPNPAFSHVDVPLASTFVLSVRQGNEAYIVPEVCRDRYRFTVSAGTPPNEAAKGTKLARGAKFRCLLSNTAIDPHYIKEEASHGRMGEKLMAVVAAGPKSRIFLSPCAQHEEVAAGVDANDARREVHLAIAEDPRPMTCLLYGMTHFDHLFTSRQLRGLSTFTKLIQEVKTVIESDASHATPHAEDSDGELSYSEAVATYLAMCVSKASDLNNALCGWKVDAQCPVHLFGRQAIPIIWDFAEANLLSGSTCSWLSVHQNLVRSMSPACLPAIPGNHLAQQASARELGGGRRFISTDPPYYDNIGYADLSDFFYVWLRLSLRHTLPDLFSTIAVPKEEELVAAAYRHRGKAKAEHFFMQGMTAAMSRLSDALHPSAPLTLYYAFKQSETKGDLTNSAGWETFLEAVLSAGLTINGTWPVRTEQANRMRSLASNALASSVVLVCRPRSGTVGTVSRRQYVRLLNETLPDALTKITGAEMAEHSPVAPVDLSQAIIGPGMAIFSKYEAVLEADGTPMTVKTALQLINRFLAEDDFDADTQFCLHWFDECGWDAGKYGQADTLARAKGTSVDGVKDAGVIASGSGNVRLLKWKEYDADWDAATDSRLPVWEVLHRLIRAYSSQGDAGAAKVLAACANKAEAARQLAYRLYTLCERKGWAEDARAYNEVVTGWTGIEKATVAGGASQRELFDA